MFVTEAEKEPRARFRYDRTASVDRAAGQPVRGDGPGVEHTETPTATLEELHTFRAKAKEPGMPSLATAALIGWELVQREADIFSTFTVRHYRPKEHPDVIRVVHEKTGNESRVPLLDEGRRFTRN